MEQNDWIGKWISEQEIDVLNYKSNFSNWTGNFPIRGHFLFEIKFDNKKKEYSAQVRIPVMTIGGKGHYPIIGGRYERERDEIKIWQNEKIPVKIRFKIKSNKLSLKLYGKEILFQR